MKNSNKCKTILILLGMMSAVLAACVQLKAQTSNSAPSSPPSGIPANNQEVPTVKVINACAAAANELTVTRELVKALEREGLGLRQSLDLSKQAEAVLTEINMARQAEVEALRTVIAAKNDAITAKNAALESQNNLIAELKRRKSSVWKRLGDVLIGAAAAAILK